MRAPGDPVRTRSANPPGHTRLPAYLLDKAGRIEAVHGAVPLADERAAGRDRPEPLYTVAFEARDIWPETGAAFTIHADLWESYFDAGPR